MPDDMDSLSRIVIVEDHGVVYLRVDSTDGDYLGHLPVLVVLN